VAADGKLYVVSDAGMTTVMQAGDTPKILAVNDLEDSIVASPAFAGGCIFLRSDRYIYCIGGERNRSRE
jgi:hypothetical protein